MFDSHTHVAAEQFDQDRAEVIARAKQSGVEGWIEIGTTVSESRAAIELAQANENVFASVGVHPGEVAHLNEADWFELERMLTESKVVAVGEVGLDFHRGGTVETQLPALKRFLSLAADKKMPVIFHVRSGEQDAHAILLDTLRQLPVSQRPAGALHMFSGTLEQAREYLSLGCYISISGIVTFKNAGELIEVARQVPLEKLLVETDAPYVAPEPCRGQRNEPAFVRYVIEKIAALRGLSFGAVEKTTAENAERVFGI